MHTHRMKCRTVWHQMLRRVCMSNPSQFTPLTLSQILLRHTTALTNMLGIRSKWAQSVITLYVAFLVSGLIHLVGDYALLRDWHARNSIHFFMLQALAISFESTVFRVLRLVGVTIPPFISRLVGYVWVLCWFTLTLPIWLEPIVRDGFLEDGWHHPIVSSTGLHLQSYLGI